MGYFIRILGLQDPNIHIDELAEALRADGISAEIGFDLNEKPSKWTILDISNSEGEQIAQLERNSIKEIQEELQAFRDSISKCRPATAVKWLDAYFDQVKVVYVFHLLATAFDDDNFEIIDVIKNCIWDKTGGIFQADQQGFTNEEGYHVLWQFNDEANGEWDCAVLGADGKWQKFTMDLGDAIQRQEFKSGILPLHAKRIEE